ncbi:MAG TPA: glycosyltransferase, partial [Chloroflexia bacterium]|nr:glycosyltransferase [Chloroflexia bacterium]
ARVVAISFPESAGAFPPGRTVLTGNPLRPGLGDGDPARARAHWRLDPALPVIYVTGGMLGAHAINTALHAALPQVLADAQVVHQVGEGPDGSRADLRAAEAVAAGDPLARARYRPVAFVGPELADLYALATLVVGRAGAGTVNELAALGKPAVLIPLPGAAADEQTANAQRLAGAGGAVVLPQTEATPARLAQIVRSLLAAPDRLAQMAAAGPALARPDAADRLVDLILQLAQPR